MVYGAQVRQPIHKGPARKVEPFWTYGLMGAVARGETSSCVNRHCTYERQTYVLPPALIVVGAGLEYHVKPRVAVRFDYQAGMALLFPVGARAGIGVSIPLGHAGTSSADAR
ncbi:MAG TPA: hypothetical protein VGY57_07755 [Vicinamibacterales bacterium]|jgi:hypothetical protein|nr:hypothetical protein [Vicinamibacterales bacterium]